MGKPVQVNIRYAREGGAKDDAEPVLDVFCLWQLATCLFLAVAFTSNLQLVQATGTLLSAICTLFEHVAGVSFEVLFAC
jgi:hypothetical protein